MTEAAPTTSAVIYDLVMNAGHYGSLAFLADAAGDAAGCTENFAIAGRFAKSANDLEAQTKSLGDAPLAPNHRILDETFVDQHGVQWVPRQFQNTLSVPLIVDEILALRSVYADAAQRALSPTLADRWAFCEMRRDDLLVQATELDPGVVAFRHVIDPDHLVATC